MPAKPRKTTFKVFLLSLFITFSFVVGGVLIELFRSLSLSITSGIALGAGGFSWQFLMVMVFGISAVFVLSYLALKRFFK